MLASLPESGTESELKAIAGALEAVIDTAPVAVIALDPAGMVRMWNLGAEAIFGWTAAEVLGRPLPTIPEGSESEFRALLDAHLAGTQHSGVELRRRKKDGSLADVTLWTAPRRTPAGQTEWAMAVLVDTTGQKRAEDALKRNEEELRRARDEMELRVGERTRELTELNAALQAEIKERQKAEEALRKSEERFRLLLEGIEDYAIVMLDPAGTVVSWNSGAERILGYTADEILGEHFSRFYPQDDVRRGTPQDELLVAAAEGRFGAEAWRVRRDGTRLWANIAITALYDENGNVRGFSDVTRDATRRKQAQEDRERLLRAIDGQRQLFQTVIEHAPAGIAVFDGKTLRVKWANPNFRQMQPEPFRSMNVTGMRIQEFIPRAEENGVAGVFRQVAETGRPYIHPEYELTGASGEKSYWRLSLLPLRTDPGQVPDLFLLSTEITEQVVARKKLEELAAQVVAERAQLQAVLRQMPSAVVIAEAPSGKVILGNEQVSQIWRRPFVAEGGIEHFAPYFHEDGRPYLPEEYPLAVSIRTGQVVTGREIEVLRGDGTRGTIRLSSAPIRDRDGNIVAGVSTFYDITEQKRAEEEIRRLNQHLEQRTAELAAINQQLGIRNREVERANRMKSEFLATMSHELRTPLHAIAGFSDLLAEESAGELNAKQKRQAGHIRQSARHLLTLINDILDLSKIEAGRLELHVESFTAHAALLEVLTTIGPAAIAKHLQVIDDLDPGLVVRADRVRFKQILYNLLSNAVKFTAENGTVRIAAAARDDSVEISVSDTGIGIPAEEQAAIFDEFHQASATTKGVKEGTGLGLAITRRLVEKHGGSISVESAPGKGSCFRFRLPLRACAQSFEPQAESAAAHVTGGDESALARKKILIADDSEPSRDFIRDTLEARNFLVVEACDGAEALKAIAGEKPDLVLMDIQMPNMDGFDALRCLRADPRFSGLPVVALTAFAMQGDREKALAAGFNDYIPKPVNPATLRSRIELLLAK